MWHMMLEPDICQMSSIYLQLQICTSVKTERNFFPSPYSLKSIIAVSGK